MTVFIIRRVVWTIPVILLVILMTFLLMKQIKGNPFRHTERNVPEAIQKNLERKFHLDRPWYVQYAYYVKGVFTFDLGPSMAQRSRTVLSEATARRWSLTCPPRATLNLTKRVSM